METKFIENMDEELYHSDPFEQITLSSSMAATFITGTPKNVWMESRRLNPKHESSHSKALDKGNILDALILGGADIVRLIDATDYKTKDARMAKEQAREEGKIPLLAKDWPDILRIRDALFEELDKHEEHSDALKGGIYQGSVFWQNEESGVCHRARFDHVNPETGWIDDLKTTGIPINRWIKNLFNEAKDIQSSLYEEAFEYAFNKRPMGFRYVVVETVPPYLSAVVVLDLSSKEVAVKKLNHARDLWKYCLKSNDWFGYPRTTLYASSPAWVENEVDEKITNWEALMDIPKPPREKKFIEPHRYLGA